MYVLPPLPYDHDALEPWVSAQTLKLHHDVLHKRYVDRLNEMVGTRSPSLEQIIVHAEPGPILDNASQVWNHTFLWHSMTPVTHRPSRGTAFYDALTEWDRQRPFPALSKAIVDASSTIFGSGYVWLVADPEGALRIWPLRNAENPLRELRDHVPLLTIDVWEHAYLFDYGADRTRYTRQFVEKIGNWQFAEENYARAFH